MNRNYFQSHPSKDGFTRLVEIAEPKVSLHARHLSM